MNPNQPTKQGINNFNTSFSNKKFAASILLPKSGPTLDIQQSQKASSPSEWALPSHLSNHSKHPSNPRCQAYSFMVKP
jgi:hypothetical protein